MAWLSAAGRGFQLKPGSPRIPIVPSAVIFDLRDAPNFNAADNPYGRLGKVAVANAGAEFALGNAGAGLGAIAGAYKGGVGSASAVIDGAITVGALVVVNSLGSPVIPGTGLFWAFPFEQGNEFGGRRLHTPFPELDLDLPLDGKAAPLRGANTTIAVVATDAELTRLELQRVAIMATDGFARALHPVHTPFDGDTLFALTTGAKPVSGDRLRELTRIGSVAADCIARAIARGVYAAGSVGEVKSYRERFGESL